MNQSEILTPRFIPALDGTMAGLIIILVLLAVPGNSSSFIFFFGRQDKNLHNLLYAVMSATDICTCCFAVSPLVSLFNERQPVVYSSPWTCVTWGIGAKFSIFFSMFVVLMMSVTRTIAIVAPFHTISRSAVIGALVGYGAGMLIVDAFFVGFKFWYFEYSWRVTGCSMFISPQAPNWSRDIQKNVMMLELLIPSLTVFTSFIISTIYIVKQKNRTLGKKNDKKFKQASVTISILTAAFLICNLPFFAIHLLNNLTVWVDMGFTFHDLPILEQYGWLVTHCLLPLINATINPCLYLMRMPRFRGWVTMRIKDINEGVLSSGGS